ncbi:MAG: hypothetical protein FWH19_05860 [Treponema sp.]|nr:hypothetical protein [Treponema sp.]
MKNNGPAFLAAALLFVFFSCASNPAAYAPIDSNVRFGSFDGALYALNNERNRSRGAIYGPGNDILFYLDRGMIQHFAGLYSESSQDFLQAERLIEEAFTRSLSQELGTFILNDNARDYGGEDYEDLYINVFNALNFYHMGNLEGALVEVRRLNEKLNHMADRYERAKRRVTDSNELPTEARLPMEASQFSNSALARYMGMLFYRGTGRTDSARIDYQELLRAYELAPEVYYHSLPASVHEELTVPAGLGRLNLIAFTGLSPIKVEENIVVPLLLPAPYHFARLPLPRIVNRPQYANRVEAVLDSGQRFPLELLEDMGAVARETFKSRYGLTVLKTTARVMIKYTAGLGATAAAAQNNDGGLAILVAFFSRIFAEASERADLRLSRFFPSHALVGGINLAPGNYELTVNYYGFGGLLHSEQRQITVRQGGLNLEEFVFLR